MDDIRVEEYLARKGVDADVIAMAACLCTCSKEVGVILATTPVHHVGTANAFGDAQLSVDVKSDQRIFDVLKQSRIVSHAASEEEPEIRELMTPMSETAQFTVCFDPLDGSSIVDCNWSVGSIFGVWPSVADGSVTGRCGRDQVLSAVAIYGPRTSVILAVGASACANGITGGFVVEATLVNNEWIVTNDFPTTIARTAKIFSPANLRAAQDLDGYASLVNEWMTKRLTLRYTGGMVPDVAGILIKGNGIFCSPVSAKAAAKLRLVFECAPIALLIELGGGMALTGRKIGEDVLDVKIESMDDRIGIVCGSADEVVAAVERILK